MLYFIALKPFNYLVNHLTKVNTKDYINRAGNKQGLLLRGCHSFAQCKQRLTTWPPCLLLFIALIYGKRNA